MPIMSRILKSIILAGTFFAACQLSMAATSLPPAVQLSNQRFISAGEHALIISGNHGKSDTIKVSSKFGKAISSSSEIVFPEPKSLVIDGQEFVLVLVGKPSSNKPLGYCGSGTESTLYALRIGQKSVTVAFEKLVQSCLQNIDLASDGVAPPYRSVSWNAQPTGIRIRWMSDEARRETTGVFEYRGGRFVQSHAGESKE
ncbi:hypothetical protein [Paraburkholderia sacchari]|uniref:hypothetical protein n=1 Tax=Paraburkholderia sacchari TaxID=159450 RepID=UPI0039A4B578